MDPKQQIKPQPAPVRTIKARVKPGNKYGMALEGEIVDVDPAELVLCDHALESLDAEKARDVKKAESDEAEKARLQHLADQRAALMAQRDASMNGQKIARERRLNRQIAAMEAAKA